jgi:murein DD-endopeptidase MepM/ murein hydrolase activator NlpD
MDRTSKRTVKLIVCVAIFMIAAFMKLVFPAALQTVGDKLNSVVNYRAALASLGEGISGEKNFTTALGEAFTYAFTGASPDAKPVESGAPAQQTAGADKANAAASDSLAAGEAASAANPSGDGAVETFSESSAAPQTDSSAAASPSAGVSDGETSFSDAVRAAFLQDQEQYSDYAIPAGVSYEKPNVSLSFTQPVKGTVSSSFGYRVDPTNKDARVVRFHYGTDISAKEGTPVAAAADGKVISAGESTTLGNYMIINHGGIETEYAHCQKLFVEDGQVVKKGDKIAAVGSTGNATETCLHFELRVHGQYVNPEFYIKWT